MMVLGIDVGLVRTGVAALRDGEVLKTFTIAVEGDTKDTGPRYVKLRESLSLAKTRLLAQYAPPVLVAVEIPDEDEGEDGLREGHEKMDVAKLYGAYAVLYAEAARLWPKARVLSVTPRQWKGNLPKAITARMTEVRYGVGPANSHEADAVMIADWGAQVARALEHAK